jgi:aminocarboxymuconate-semialdehyde decarboxylase
VILDCHCHVIPAGMLTSAVPADWRPVVSQDAGRPVVSFQGRRLTSITGEFCDVDVMLAQAAAVGRVLALGSVPLQDSVHAVAELGYLMSLPGMRGVEVPASVAGRYIGDDSFAPFWAAAAESGAVVFVHPSTRGLGLPALDSHYLWNSIGNPVETAIAAAQLVTNGVLARHRDLKVLLAHGGGALLTLRGRLDRAFAVRAEARAASPEPPSELLRGLYFDSLTHDRAVLADLVAFAGPGHVVLGSDRPFDMGADGPADDVAALGLSPADEQLLLSGTACMLLGLKDTSEVDSR